MDDEKTVTFYLHPKLRRQAQAGNHNFISLVKNVLDAEGLQVAFDADTHVARLRARTRLGYGLFLMDEPVNERCLTMRKTYIFPFWRIEKQSKRWAWPVALAQFDTNEIDPRQAVNFFRFWRRRLFEDHLSQIGNDGFVYVPLQGQLTTQRSFQYCSPIDMVKAVLAHEPRRRIIVTLHPSELYTNAERTALEHLIADNKQLTLQTGDPNLFLRSCDYIVTQNSSVGFLGYFFRKPLILFGKIDFHHIALNVHDVGIAQAFERLPDHNPDYPAYLCWFLRQQSINAGRSEAKDQIGTVLRDHGWPV